MNLRNFKQLFSAFFALLLGVIFFSVGQQLWDVSIFGYSFKVVDVPHYYEFMVTSLAVVGVLLGVFLGPVTAQSIVDAGNAIERMPTRDKIAIAFGTIVGIVCSLPITYPLFSAAHGRFITVPIALVLSVAAVYLGIRAMMSMRNELWLFQTTPPAGITAEGELLPEQCKILDTNVIIDGRVADIRRTGFLEGTIYVPGFVLDELQHIADSADSLKRARGRRGLDILNAMQKDFPLLVRVFDSRLGPGANSMEVDARLVALAKALGGVIVTNDFNLNKVAGLQGVSVLNVNELANALKPVVLPGEEMTVTIIREGKEQNQGVAYLDDGTMIVVEDGRRFIGDTIGVNVTSVLQTVAGKMIFARPREHNGEVDDQHDGGRGRASGGPRGKVR